MEEPLPVGKLPAELLAKFLAEAPVLDPRVVVGPGVGLDCAVIEAGGSLLVYKSDPITFTAEELGWYAVQINANDIATTGATPRWFLVTLLLPEGKTTAVLVEQIFHQLFEACGEIGVSLVGGHTEITVGLERPLIVGTMIGEVEPDHLVTPHGAAPGDRILLTKGVPIEATAILAREFPDRLRLVLSEAEIEQAAAFLTSPGISVLRDAQIAMQAGSVTAMHDPTEGGLAAALWELAEASNRRLIVDLTAVPIPPLSDRICSVFNLDPLATIASGALLLTSPVNDAPHIQQALEREGIGCTDIGVIASGAPSVQRQIESGYEELRRPDRDEIAGVYQE